MTEFDVASWSWCSFKGKLVQQNKLGYSFIESSDKCPDMLSWTCSSMSEGDTIIFYASLMMTNMKRISRSFLQSNDSSTHTWIGAIWWEHSRITSVKRRYYLTDYTLLQGAVLALHKGSTDAFHWSSANWHRKCLRWWCPSHSWSSRFTTAYIYICCYTLYETNPTYFNLLDKFALARTLSSTGHHLAISVTLAILDLVTHWGIPRWSSDVGCQRVWSHCQLNNPPWFCTTLTKSVLS